MCDCAGRVMGSGTCCLLLHICPSCCIFLSLPLIMNNYPAYLFQCLIRTHPDAPYCAEPTQEFRCCCSTSMASITCPSAPTHPPYTLCPSLESTPAFESIPGLGRDSTNEREGERGAANQRAAGSLFLAPGKMASDLLVIPVLRVW